MEDFGVESERISVIYNAIDHQRFFLPRLFIGNNYVSNIIFRLRVSVLFMSVQGLNVKGLRAAIEAISHTNAYLLVIGQDKEYKNTNN